MSESRELHQSGEKVLIAGIYRLVERMLEGDAGTLVTLYNGDYVPDYQGRATSWYLVRTIIGRKATVSLHTSWQDNPSRSPLR